MIANSEEPDEMPHKAAYHLRLQCLLTPNWHEWVQNLSCKHYIILTSHLSLISIVLIYEFINAFIVLGQMLFSFFKTVFGKGDTAQLQACMIPHWSL